MSSHELFISIPRCTCTDASDYVRSLLCATSVAILVFLKPTVVYFAIVWPYFFAIWFVVYFFSLFFYFLVYF